MLTDVLITKVR